jgi:hypothetical protein
MGKVTHTRAAGSTIGVALVVLGMTLMLGLGSARADSLTITTGVMGGANRTITAVGPSDWTTWPCSVGLRVISPDPFFASDYRCAIEFPLAALPADAIVTNVTLNLNSANAVNAKPTQIVGYAGDGAITLADNDVSGPSVTYTHVNNNLDNAVDITALLSQAARNAGWMGVSIRVDPPGTEESSYPIGDFTTNRTPSLVITYSLPTTTTTSTTTTTPATTTTQGATTTTATGQGVRIPDTGSGSTSTLALAAVLVAAGSVTIAITRRRQHSKA